MTVRIERTSPLHLLGELPAGWAQACITNPPASAPTGVLLSVLEGTRRVMREDGTLWLIHEDPHLPRLLNTTGWISQPTPEWGRSLAHHTTRLSLLAPNPTFFQQTTVFHEHPTQPPLTRHERRWCSWAEEYERHRRLIRLCALAGTSPVACGYCGTPWHIVRDPRGRFVGRRAACTHHDPTGRCLILDPFHHPHHQPAAGRCHRRSVLAITSPGGER